MKSTESYLEMKSHGKWEIKAKALEKPPDREAYSLLQEITEGLNRRKQEIKDWQTPVKRFLSVMERVKRKPVKKIDFNSISQANLLKDKFSSNIDRHFDELNSKFLEISQGKFNLRTIAPKKKVMESTEPLTLHGLDSSYIFCESIRRKLLQLKIKEEQLNMKNLRVFRRTKIIKLQIEKSHSSLVDYSGNIRPLVTRKNCFATTLPAISGSIL